MDKVLVGVFPATLRWDGCDSAFQDFQQGLLHAFPGHVPGDGGVVGFAGDFIHLVDVDDTSLGALHVKVGGLQQFEEDVFYVFTNVAGLGEAGGVGNGEGDVEESGECLGEVGFPGTGGAKHENVGFLQFGVVIAVFAPT